jgi:hypothetical protein
MSNYVTGLIVVKPNVCSDSRTETYTPLCKTHLGVIKTLPHPHTYTYTRL